MLDTLFGIVMLDRLLQSENAHSPMLVTLFGITILVIKQPANVQSPMLATPFGIETLVRLQK